MSLSRIISELNSNGIPKAVDPFIASLPVSVVRDDVNAAALVAREEAAEEARLHREAVERAQAADDAAYVASVHARTEPYRSGPVPSAEDLTVDIEGLSAERAELLRLVAWQARTADELAQAEAARSRLMEVLGAPAVSAKELDALVSRDKSNFLRWVMSGGSAEQPSLQTFQRQQLEARLSQQTHEAEVQRHALDTLDGQAEVLKAGVEALKPRIAKAVQATLAAEGAAPLLAEYAAALDRVRSLATELGGLSQVVPGHGLHRGFGSLRSATIEATQFGNVRGRVVVSEQELQAAARPWREREKALLADPKANVTTPKGN